MKQKPKRPPSDLGPDGRKLWKGLTAEFVFADAASFEYLRVACVARDRLTAAEAAIREHGPTFVDRFGQIRKNPAVQVERDATVTMLSAMKACGLHELPADRGGRPAGGKKP